MSERKKDILFFLMITVSAVVAFFPVNYILKTIVLPDVHHELFYTRWMSNFYRFSHGDPTFGIYSLIFLFLFLVSFLIFKFWLKGNCIDWLVPDKSKLGRFGIVLFLSLSVILFIIATLKSF
jgi:hypothetical protein